MTTKQLRKRLGKSDDEPITMGDVAKGLKNNKAARSMANFARMAKQTRRH